MDTESLPWRVFLDTCAINFILDHGESIHEFNDSAPDTPERVRVDIEAFQGIFATGQRAFWELAVSPHTYREVVATRDPTRMGVLHLWFLDIWNYWREVLHSSTDLPSFSEAEELRVALLSSGALDVLPDLSDRILLIDAVLYRCDLFCTRDWSTIVKHRDALADLPVRIVTPKEWWNTIRPWSGLFW